MRRGVSAPATALALAGVLVLLSGCGTPAPQPSASQDSTAGASPRPTPPEATASALPSPTDPDMSSLVDLGLELDIGVLDSEHTDHILSFVSDGGSILYSSGIEPDVATKQGAPDLWRLQPFGEPEIIWRNPSRDHSLVTIAADAGTYAFVDIPLTGERAWTLYLIPRHGDSPIVLDEHPGDEDVPSFVPSFIIHERRVVWTAFDRGSGGPVSQLWTAAEPAWEPELLLSHPAEEIEIWLPSLLGSMVAYTEVRYSDDRLSDERSVWLMRPGDRAGPRRLDTSGLATMPILVPGAVLWKEADPGYNMFNWGRMYRYDLETAEVTLVDISPQTYVNYPSGGQRYAAWRGSDSFEFGVYDHVLDEARVIERNPPGSDTGVLRPHITSGLLVWMRVIGSDEHATGELRYAWMPDAAEVRGSRTPP